MANISKINGFRAVKHLTGAPYNGQFNKYAVPSSDGTALFVGDVVKLAADGDVNGYKNVARAAAGDAIIGVVVGFDINPLNLNTPQYRAASTARVVYVADAADLLLEVEVSNPGAGSFTNASILGENYNHANGTGSTTTGASGATLDLNAGTAGGATATFKVVQFVDRADNDNTSNSSRVLVKINNHQYAGGTGTAGV